MWISGNKGIEEKLPIEMKGPDQVRIINPDREELYVR